MLNDIKLYNLEEAAAILKVSTKTARVYIKDGRIQAQKIGRGWQITEENLRKFITGETNNNTSS